MRRGDCVPSDDRCRSMPVYLLCVDPSFISQDITVVGVDYTSKYMINRDNTRKRITSLLEGGGSSARRLGETAPV